MCKETVYCGVIISSENDNKVETLLLCRVSSKDDTDRLVGLNYSLGKFEETLARFSEIGRRFPEGRKFVCPEGG